MDSGDSVPGQPQKPVKCPTGNVDACIRGRTKRPEWLEWREWVEKVLGEVRVCGGEIIQDPLELTTLFCLII